MEDIGVDGTIILRWIYLQKERCGALNGTIWLRMGEVAGTCEYNDDHSGSIKSREFLDQLRTG